jgi:aminoglycoside N3'-acetyltransferase
VTLLHFAEYLCDIPHKHRQRRHRVVMGPGGAEVRVVDTLDDSNGFVEYPGEDYFAVILKAYLAAHQPPRATVGHAPSELLDARELVDFAERWMTANLAPGNSGTP